MQDYSKSPIKPVSSPDLPSPITAPKSAYEPITGQQNQAASFANVNAPTITNRSSVNYGAPPPRKSMDARPSFDNTPAPPATQQLDSQTSSTQTSSYSSPYPNPQVSSSNTYGQPPATQAYQSGYTPQDQSGYRQNPIHDGGSTDYTNNDGQFNMEYAEKTWKAATETVSEYTSTAGEVAGNALGSIKGWLNPESKGMR